MRGEQHWVKTQQSHLAIDGHVRAGTDTAGGTLLDLSQTAKACFDALREEILHASSGSGKNSGDLQHPCKCYQQERF